ncbi:MAG: site-specific DNA-methyltransferase [Polyangiaceae bacterium]|nr:site-specific DNA-methyltransferase [Polyangiaceae bacterium]
MKAAECMRLVRHHGEAGADNLLVHGDNLAALLALRGRFEGKIRCAYLDPPFNTGRTFAEYTDVRTSDDWASMIESRLRALAPLLADDGAVFAEIDDTELARLISLMDETFGAKNRISTITIVRSAPTGHKAKNQGPVHVSDFLLAYAKNKKLWRYNLQMRVRNGYDSAYRTWLDNPSAPPAHWAFRPLRTAVCHELGYPSVRDAERALGGRHELAHTIERYALDHAEHVVRFALPRYEAIARAMQKVVDESRAEPSRTFAHEREGRPPFFVRGGNRILFLKDKIKSVNHKNVIVQPITNVWDDVKFQGIAREGGVAFSRNKKPEFLVSRVIAMASKPGDWVIDPFLGSGTTAAVAHKMGRRWIGIESGDHCETLCERRLVRVVAGTDDTGVSALFGFEGGGGFAVARI